MLKALQVSLKVGATEQDERHAQLWTSAPCGEDIRAFVILSQQPERTLGQVQPTVIAAVAKLVVGAVVQLGERDGRIPERLEVAAPLLDERLFTMADARAFARRTWRG